MAKKRPVSKKKRTISKAAAKGRAAYNNAASLGTKTPKRKSSAFKNKVSKTRYDNMMIRASGKSRNSVTKAKEQGIYKKAQSGKKRPMGSKKK